MKLFLVLLFAAILSSVAYSQRSSVCGMVVDPNGASIENVMVEATGRDGRIRRTSSQDDGSYKLELPAGNYSIAFASRRGFRTTNVTNYSIPEKTAMHLDVLLEIDLESPSSIISEFICDKNGKCDYVSRRGRGSVNPKEISITSQRVSIKKS